VKCTPAQDRLPILIARASRFLFNFFHGIRTACLQQARRAFPAGRDRIAAKTMTGENSERASFYPATHCTQIFQARDLDKPFGRNAPDHFVWDEIERDNAQKRRPVDRCRDYERPGKRH
jgi:hypothetical protein